MIQQNFAMVWTENFCIVCVSNLHLHLSIIEKVKYELKKTKYAYT